MGAQRSYVMEAAEVERESTPQGLGKRPESPTHSTCWEGSTLILLQPVVQGGPSLTGALFLG